MPGKLFLIIKRSLIKILVVIIIIGITLSNLFAYKHAYAMLHFSQNGERTAKPEALTIQQKIITLLTGVTIPKPENDFTPERRGLTYETHHVKVNEEVQLEAWYIPHSQSKGIILMFHGYASSKSSLLPEAQVFNKMGYEAFLVDFRGSGGSNQSETSIGYHEADDVTASIDYVQTKWRQEKLYLYGQSMGGVAILRAISENGVNPDGIIIEAVFDRMLSTVENRFRSMGIPPFPGAQILVYWGGIINGHSGFRHNPVEYAANISCPVLMLHGTDDERATIDQAQAVFEQINSDKKYFETFADVSHESYVGANPEQWTTRVSDFLYEQNGN